MVTAIDKVVVDLYNFGEVEKDLVKSIIKSVNLTKQIVFFE